MKGKGRGGPRVTTITSAHMDGWMCVCVLDAHTCQGTLEIQTHTRTICSARTRISTGVVEGRFVNLLFDYYPHLYGNNRPLQLFFKCNFICFLTRLNNTLSKKKTRK